MVNQMRNVARLNTELTMEERNLLSVAYKNVIGSRRASWRIIAAIISREESKNDNLHLLPKAKEYLAKIEKEIITIIDDILQLLDKNILPVANTIESQVFFFKMQGDYNRYLAELANTDAILKSHRAYITATDIAKTGLPPTDPIRLGLALNYSVFYYEILHDPETSCQMSKNAFDEAISQLDSVDEESYKDTTIIMQLLRDGLTLWTSDFDDIAEEGDKL